MSKILIGLCVFVMLVITPSVKADPIVVTGGSLTVVGTSGFPNYTLTGQNFSVTAEGRDPGNTPGCIPCPSGTPISLSSFLAGSTLGFGNATINGTTFNDIFFVGQFNLAAGTVELPAGLTEVTVTLPFSFSGFLVGCEDSLNCSAFNQLFGTDLVGQGTVTAIFDSGFPFNGITLYSFRSVTYEFQGSGAEIAEPMTILLLTSGLIGLSARGFRTCRKNRILKN
jgi:hypothetical protein